MPVRLLRLRPRQIEPARSTPCRYVARSGEKAGEPLLVDVFTLATGDYVYGAAALCNSLAAAGFSGAINVGVDCAGQLPWTIDRSAPIAVHAIAEGGKWIGNHKP